MEIMAQLIHFFFVVQLIGLRGSDGSFQSTTFPVEAETTRSMPAFSSASSVVSLTGTPFSTSGSSFASCDDDDGNVDSDRRDGDVPRVGLRVSSPTELGFSGSAAMVTES